MKIKVRPEDFVVREQVDIVAGSSDDIGPASCWYRIYLLKKRAWNTLDALRLIAKENRIPMAQIGYCGRKDRYAVTYQHISVPVKYGPLDTGITRRFPNIELELLGYSRDFVSTRNLAGNHFELVLRQIAPGEENGILQRAREVSMWGFPNYFDDQRFGSVVTGPTGAGDDQDTSATVQYSPVFFAERLLKRQYNGCLKLYMTWAGTSSNRSRADIACKLKIEGLWGNWADIKPLCVSDTEKKIIEILEDGSSKSNLVRAVAQIPREELSMYVAAYQSHIWNSTLSMVLQRFAGCCESLTTVSGKVAEYCFYRVLQEEKFDELKRTLIPTVSSKILPAEQWIIDEIYDILEKRQVALAMFNQRDVRKVFFKSFYRPAIIVPENFEIADLEEDDLYPGYRKLEMNLALPPGSFATMLVKGLTV